MRSWRARRRSWCQYADPSRSRLPSTAVLMRLNWLRYAGATATLAALACARTAPQPAPATSPEITAADLEHRLFLIAHDSMMGRETGSEGAYKATDYIASEFRRLGLEAA